MASITETINWLEKLPEDIKETGKSMVRSSIISHGNVESGNMLNSVQGAAGSNWVRIRVWRWYASLVNDGNRGSGDIITAKHRTRTGAPGWMQSRSGWYARKVHAHSGSHFFEDAYENLLSYIKSL